MAKKTIRMPTVAHASENTQIAQWSSEVSFCSVRLAFLLVMNGCLGKPALGSFLSNEMAMDMVLALGIAGHCGAGLCLGRASVFESYRFNRG